MAKMKEKTIYKEFSKKNIEVEYIPPSWIG